MNRQQHLKWQVIREKGKSHYLITRGVLPYGLGITLILGLIEYVTQNGSISVWTPIRLAIFGYLGFIMANGRWQSKEKKYKETTSKS